jgi:hypothetical protein
LPQLLSNVTRHAYNPYSSSVLSAHRDPQFRVLVVAHYYPYAMGSPASAAAAASSSSAAAAAPTVTSVAAGSKGRVLKQDGKVACMVSGQLGAEN